MSRAPCLTSLVSDNLQGEYFYKCAKAVEAKVFSPALECMTEFTVKQECGAMVAWTDMITNFL